MLHWYNAILNKKEPSNILIGTVVSLSPLTVTLLPEDTAIPVVPTTNLFGITINSRIVLQRFGTQFIGIGVIGSPKIDCIEIRKTTEQAITTTTATKIEFDAEHYKSGSNLTFDSYGVKIGAGISKVLVFAQVWAHCNSVDAYSSIYIYKNSTVYNFSIWPRRTTNSGSYYISDSWRTVSGIQTLSVEEDDYIYAYIRFTDADAGNKVDDYANASKLVVQAIEYNLTAS